MMNPAITRDFARGAAVGAINLTVFGALWALAALGAWPQTPVWTFVVVGLTAAALAVFSVVRYLAAGKLPAEQINNQVVQQWQRTRTWFAVTFVVQGILIAAAVFALRRTGHPGLIPVAVTVIVGLHFWPLAYLFHMPLYWLTGLLLLVCAAAALLIGESPERLLVLGLAVALVLWTSAVITLIRYTGYSAAGAQMSGQ